MHLACLHQIFFQEYFIFSCEDHNEDQIGLEQDAASVTAFLVPLYARPSDDFDILIACATSLKHYYVSGNAHVYNSFTIKLLRVSASFPDFLNVYFVTEGVWKMPSALWQHGFAYSERSSS